MRVKLDENVPIDAVDLLLDGGVDDVHTVYDEGLGGVSDAVLTDRARLERRVLITLDMDFADLRAYPPDQYAGLIVLRPHEPDRETTLRLLGRLLPLLHSEAVEGALWIVEENRVRMRRIE